MERHQHGLLKKQMHREQREVLWEEYRDTAQLCRGEVRKDKLTLKPNLARDAKHSKDLYSYVSWKWKVKAKLVTVDKEKAQLLFCLNGNLSFHTLGLGGEQDGDWGSKVLPTYKKTSCS